MYSEPEGEKPCGIDTDHLTWTMLSHTWHGGQHDEDQLEVRHYFAADEWEAHTERNQSIVRDVSDEDVAIIRRQFGLDAWAEFYRPEVSLKPGSARWFNFTATPTSGGTHVD